VEEEQQPRRSRSPYRYEYVRPRYYRCPSPYYRNYYRKPPYRRGSLSDEDRRRWD
jgi:hypothetical protein